MKNSIKLDTLLYKYDYQGMFHLNINESKGKIVMQWKIMLYRTIYIYTFVTIRLSLLLINFCYLMKNYRKVYTLERLNI